MGDPASGAMDLSKKLAAILNNLEVNGFSPVQVLPLGGPQNEPIYAIIAAKKDSNV